MRPELSGVIEEKVEQYYESAGYATPSELVRDAVRRRISELEEELDVPENEYEIFKYEVSSSQASDYIHLDLSPKPNSGLSLKYVEKGNPPHYVELKTNNKTIREDDLKSALTDIDGVADAGFITKPRIRIDIWKDAERPFPVLVREIFNALYELVGQESIEQVEQDRRNQLADAVDDYASSM